MKNQVDEEQNPSGERVEVSAKRAGETEMNNTRYVTPKDSAYCPECCRWPQQERTQNHGERLCSSGHTFTLKESRSAFLRDYPETATSEARALTENVR